MQLIFWEAPFRTLLWDQQLLKPIVENILNTDWKTYANSPQTDVYINDSILFVGWIFIISALACVTAFLDYYKKISTIIIYIGAILLALVIFLEFKEKFYHTAQLIEGAIQVGTCFLFPIWINQHIGKRRLALLLKIVIGLCFAGHGLYAIGFYATPGKFIDMTIILLGVNETQAKLFLHIVGWLDILIFPLLFTKFLWKPALIYAILWGFLTSFARMAYYLVLNNFEVLAFSMLHDTLFRLSHGLIPLSLYILLSIINSKKVKL
ncbi:MAG: hypothetical protein ACR2MS_02040 [Weeksellaceae bacterium]